MSFLRRLFGASSAADSKQPMFLLFPKDVTWKLEDVEKLESDGDFGEALRRWQTLLKVFQDPDLPREYILLPFHRHIHLHIGMCYRHLERYRDALDAYERAGVLAKQAGDEPFLAELASNRGIVYRRSGDVPSALRCYQEALEKATLLKDWNLVLTALDNVSVCYFDQRDIEHSLTESTKAYTILQKRLSQIRPLVQSRVLGTLGMLYALKGKIPEGRQLLETALKKAREADNRVQESVILDRLGQI